MVLSSVFAGSARAAVFDSVVVVEFVLAFAFFSALALAVLGKPFGVGRGTVVLAVALGLLLAIGLVRWAHERGWSLSEAGPVAVGWLIGVVGLVVFHAAWRIGGGWWGVGVGVLLAGALFVDVHRIDVGSAWPVLVVMAAVAIIGLGVAALNSTRRWSDAESIARRAAAWPDDRMRALYRERALSERVVEELRGVRRMVDRPGGQSAQAGDVLVQLRRILPEAGLLTEQLAQLRAMAHRVRRGHVARIAELRSVIAKLPPEKRRAFAEELARRYEELKFNNRIDRLDRAVAENERRIRQLVRQAEAWVANHEYRRLSRVLDEAARLQGQNARLLQVIERSQQRLLAGAQRFAAQPGGVSRG